MKRICFLLTFFLTGFSLVANKQSLRNSYLFACNDEVFEVNLATEPIGKEFFKVRRKAGFLQHDLPQSAEFICLARK